MYTEPGPECARSMSTKNCIEIGADLEYIREISDIIYRLNVDDIARSKCKNKAQAEDQAEMRLDYRVLNRI